MDNSSGESIVFFFLNFFYGLSCVVVLFCVLLSCALWIRAKGNACEARK
jgi:hypothetical protein